MQALSPANGAIVSNTATPTLKWAAFPGAVSYSVVIYNSQPELVFSQTTGNTQITISPPLPPGTYNWGVFASDATYQIAFVGNDYFTSCYVHVVPTYVGAAEKAAFVAPNIAVPPAPATAALEYARACGFAGFDWVQEMDVTPGGVYAQNDPSAELKVPPAPPYLDPSAGSYTYNFTCLYQNMSSIYNLPGCDNSGLRNPWLNLHMPNFASANPYYYSPNDLNLNTCELGLKPPALDCLRRIMPDSYTLNFFDAPHNTSCTTIISTCFAITTKLVGICGTEPSAICNSPGMPSTPLYYWTWMSNFNGSSGGVYDDETASVFPPDPGSGTGGVTITGINGVQLPPVVPADQVATTASGLAYSRVSQTFNGTVTIKNISGSAISGPLQILLFGMPANVTLVDATGDLSGTPYLTVPALASLAPGQSATVSVQFKNPSNATINFTPAIYSGSIN